MYLARTKLTGTSSETWTATNLISVCRTYTGIYFWKRCRNSCIFFFCFPMFSTDNSRVLSFLTDIWLLVAKIGCLGFFPFFEKDRTYLLACLLQYSRERALQSLPALRVQIPQIPRTCREESWFGRYERLTPMRGKRDLGNTKF